MTIISIDRLDHNLAAAVQGENRGPCELHEIDVPEATVSNQAYQVLWFPELRRDDEVCN